MVKKLIVILILSAVTVSAVEVSVDESASQGLWYNSGDGLYKIVPNCDFALAIRYDNSDGILENAIELGFEVYLDNDRNDLPDPEGSFTVVSWSINENYKWVGTGGFFDVFDFMTMSADGLGADTVANFGLSFFSGKGLPAGFNDIGIYIESGAVDNGSVFCIDSAWFPPSGVWMWQSGVNPDWQGPFCYEAMDPGIIPPTVINLPEDTIEINSCGVFTYDFDCADGGVEFVLNSDKGVIDQNSGVFSYEYKYPRYFEIDFTVFKYALCLGTTYTLPVKIDVIESHELGDLNQNCSCDIGDIVYYIDYVFNDGPDFPLPEMADCDHSGVIDISDLIYLADYLLHDGPPPYNPFE